MDYDIESFMGLLGEEHLSPCILGEVPWSVLCAIFPVSQVLKEFLQELKPAAMTHGLQVVSRIQAASQNMGIS